MSFAALIAFAAALFVAALSPGPGVFAVVSSALGRGLAAALALTAGAVVGDLVFMLLAVYGLAALAAAMGGLFLIVKLAGAAYLVWLGVRLWRAAAATAAAGNVAAAPGPRGLGRNAAAGLAVTLGNPKTIAFYIGFLPTFVDLTRLGPADVMALAAVVVVVVGGVLGGYAFAAAGARRTLATPRRTALLNRAAGSVMIGTGMAIAVR